MKHDAKTQYMQSQQPCTSFVLACSKKRILQAPISRSQGVGGGRSPPTCKPLEKLTVVKEGSLLDMIPVHVRKSERSWGVTAPLVCKSLKLRDVTVAEVDSLTTLDMIRGRV